MENKNEEKGEALSWWDTLPMQNLEIPKNSWAYYCRKYFPNKSYCGNLNDNEILIIWKQENEKKI